MGTKTIRCPIDGKSHHWRHHSCLYGEPCEAFKWAEWNYRIEHKDEKGQCLECNKPLKPVPPIDLSSFDILWCEQTGPNDNCYIPGVGILCKNGKLHETMAKQFKGKSCRTLEPDTWRREVERQNVARKVTDRFHVQGKRNERKWRRYLNAEGGPPVRDRELDRGEIARERYFFLLAYECKRQGRQNRKLFCSEKCRAKYHRKMTKNPTINPL